MANNVHELKKNRNDEEEEEYIVTLLHLKKSDIEKYLKFIK